MTPRLTPEFKMQTFQSEDQWKSGLLCKLKIDEQGVTLFSSPTFAEWVKSADAKQKTIGGLVVDECKQIYWTERKRVYRNGNPENRWFLNRFNLKSKFQEEIIRLDDCVYHPKHVVKPERMLMDRFTLWIHVRSDSRSAEKQPDQYVENHYVLAFSRESFQLKYVIDIPGTLVDITLDSEHYLYLLEKIERHRCQDSGTVKIPYRICKYHRHGRPVYENDKPESRRQCFGQDKLYKPVSLAVGKSNLLYVIDSSNQCPGFHRFSEDGQHKFVGDFSKLPDKFKPFDPRIIAINKQENIFVAAYMPVDKKSAKSIVSLHQFDADGSYIGFVKLPSKLQTINGLSFDYLGGLYLSTNQGVGYFSFDAIHVGSKSIYYSKTLDNGREGDQWHRLKLKGHLPPGTTLDVYYYASDEAVLKETIDRTISDNSRSVQERRDEIERLLRPHWNEKEHSFRGDEDGSEEDAEEKSTGPKTIGDLLFRKNRGRYLWLKLVLSTFNEKNRPSVSEMKVYYPRISYLRYLPATYQEDPVSRDFLERFLSIFESMFYDLEFKISNLFKLFDPEITPEVFSFDPEIKWEDFLHWLASWLNLSLEEDWSEETKRKLIRNASILYRLKGTAKGLADFIEIVAGQRPIIYEDAAFTKPFVLGGKFYVGDNIVVTKGPDRGFRLGDDSILGITAIRDTPRSPDDPFKSSAHRFTVMLNLTRTKYDQHKLSIKRILDEEKPAHTEYTIRLIAETKLGHLTYVGVNTRLTGLKPFCIGVSSIPGKTVLNIKGEKGGRLERNSRIGSTLTLM